MSLDAGTIPGGPETTASDAGDDGDDEGPEVPAPPPFDPFGDKAILPIHLAFSPEAMDTIEERGNPTVEAVATVGDLPDTSITVSLRNQTKDLTGLLGKAGFTLHFDGLEEEGRLGAYRKLRLENMVRDKSLMREAFSTWVFRSLEVPAAQTRYVWLKVNEEDFGLYLAVEAPGETPFLDRWFQGSNGIVYETRGNRDVVTDKVRGFTLTRGEDPEQEALLALATALDSLQERPGDALDDLGALVDMDAFLRLSAIETLLGQKKGYVHGTRRYALHLGGEEARWTWMPLGLDQVFQDIIDPLEGKGRIQAICLGDVPCRLALAAEVEKEAEVEEEEEEEAEEEDDEESARRSRRRVKTMTTRRTYDRRPSATGQEL